jgi:hypothetical protein
MTAFVANQVRIVLISSLSVGACAAKADGVPDPVHADGALCPVELIVVDEGSPAGGDATPLLFDWAFMPNDTVTMVAGDCKGGEEGYGGRDGDEETHFRERAKGISCIEQKRGVSGYYKSGSFLRLQGVNWL